jgi:hypothetical protein
MAATPRTPPWKKRNPRSGKRTKTLTEAEKDRARLRARRAGRRYPNLVDNMHVAAEKSAAKKPAARKRKPAAKKRSTAGRTAGTSPRKPTRKKSGDATKDPSGGLTAAGRRDFRRKTGANLKPGVRKSLAHMTPQEMRRKGSWAVRFYGRSGKLPPLKDAAGKPTRFALTARTWGEPVPKTVAAARRIASKGRRLLDRYRKSKEKKSA